jgi:two-component system chemotaxis response regulator CheB
MNHDIIVIGGSAGAIDPLRTILRALPADLPAAVIVALHVSSNSTGIFQTVAAAAGALPVVSAEEGMPVEPGRIYIAVPGQHLLLVDGHIRLGDGPRENLARPAIDPLFRSAAASYGGRVIGVILSGKLNDGADGLRSVKNCGGIAVVQAPQSCTAADMPLAALEATPVDLSAEPEALAEALLKHVAEKEGRSRSADAELITEIEIALGTRFGTGVTASIATPSALSCPDCGGVMSEVNGSRPLRFRCQVGHGYTARFLEQEQEDSVDEAVRVAMRIVEERAELVHRMGRDAAEAGRPAIAELYDQRAAEYRAQADLLRKAVMSPQFRPSRPAATEDMFAKVETAAAMMPTSKTNGNGADKR